MRRRHFLRSATVALTAAFAGCLGDSDSADGDSTTDADGTATETRTDETAVPPSDVELVLVDLTSGDGPAGISVTMNGDAVFEGDVTDGRRSVDLGITATGYYDFAFAVEGGPERTYSFGVEEYTLEHGLNVIARLRDERIEVLEEE